MSEPIYTIYQITNRVNGKKYVGFTSKTIEQRLKQHFSERNKSSYPLHRAIRKYGIENFSIEAICQSKDKHYTYNFLENYFIDKLGTKIHGYNIAPGGVGGDLLTNHPNIKEIGRKISLALKGKYGGDKHYKFGKKWDDEYKRKMSLACTGRKESDHTKRLKSLALLGKKKSSAHIENLRKATCKYVYEIINPNGELEVHESISYYCKTNNLQRVSLFRASRQNKFYKNHKIISKKNKETMCIEEL